MPILPYPTGFCYTNNMPSSPTKPLSADAIEGALSLLQAIFRRVRPFILDRAGKDSHTSKADGSPVTQTDLAVENIIQSEFAKQYPDQPIYGEETGYSEALTGAYWLIDPIDGTQSFLDNTPAFTSMAVLIQDNQAIASIIYNISLDDMYVAKKGEGAYKNGERLDLAHAPLPTTADCKGRFIEPLNAILAAKQVTCQKGPSGGGFGFALVASGVSAARFNLLSRGYIHDYAPGALLVREAGGAIIPIAEPVYTYKTRSFVACHPQLETTLRAHTKQIRELEITLGDKR